ncbi:MAG: hypothetical protein ACKOPE_10645 [Novosphingobium sp.]
MLLALLLTAAAAPPTTLDQFEQTLAARDSATAALRQWCEVRHLAHKPGIRAEVAERHYRGTIPVDLIAAMGPDGDRPLGYRHVRLRCGSKVLSEAHIWYALERLTPAMNDALDHSDAPFGQVTAPLNFKRERLTAIRGAAGFCTRRTILSHTARLVLPDGRPLAYVIECYTRENLRGR